MAIQCHVYAGQPSSNSVVAARSLTVRLNTELSDIPPGDVRRVETHSHQTGEGQVQFFAFVWLNVHDEEDPEE